MSVDQFSLFFCLLLKFQLAISLVSPEIWVDFAFINAPFPGYATVWWNTNVLLLLVFVSILVTPSVYNPD